MKSTDSENLYTVVMALAEALQNKDLEIKHLNERIRVLENEVIRNKSINS